MQGLFILNSAITAFLLLLWLEKQGYERDKQVVELY